MTAGRLPTLRGAAEFKRVYTTGRTYRGPNFTLRAATAPDPDTPTVFGFVVSTKVSKAAVIRNRIRRRAREYVRRTASEIRPGKTVAVIAGPGAVTASPAETVSELSSLFKQATLIR